MRCSIANGWIGVTSLSPQYALIREKPAFACVMGGNPTPCVDAAPRATLFHSPSTCLGAIRTRSTGGKVDDVVLPVAEFHHRPHEYRLDLDRCESLPFRVRRLICSD